MTAQGIRRVIAKALNKGAANNEDVTALAERVASAIETVLEAESEDDPEPAPAQHVMRASTNGMPIPSSALVRPDSAPPLPLILPESGSRHPRTPVTTQPELEEEAQWKDAEAHEFLKVNTPEELKISVNKPDGTPLAIVLKRNIINELGAGVMLCYHSPGAPDELTVKHTFLLHQRNFNIKLGLEKIMDSAMRVYSLAINPPEHLTNPAPPRAIGGMLYAQISRNEDGTVGKATSMPGMTAPD